MLENTVYVTFNNIEKDLSVRITKHELLNIMDDEDFIWYCNTYGLTINRLRSTYCISPQGRELSPRWILEYIRDQRSELLEEANNKAITYNHSKSAVKIFEELGIKVYKVKSEIKTVTISDLANTVLKFRDDRNWSQFHNSKDLAISLSLEASELLENFQWKTSEEAIHENFGNIKEELADVLIYSILLAEKLNVDLNEAVLEKIEKNNRKYPIEKAANSKKKYTEL